MCVHIQVYNYHNYKKITIIEEKKTLKSNATVFYYFSDFHMDDFKSRKNINSIVSKLWNLRIMLIDV